jgi:hypothetical protein
MASSSGVKTLYMTVALSVWYTPNDRLSVSGELSLACPAEGRARAHSARAAAGRPRRIRCVMGVVLQGPGTRSTGRLGPFIDPGLEGA